MPIYAVSNEGINALRKLNGELKKNNNDISSECVTLKNVVSGLGSSIGVFEIEINELIDQVRMAQSKGEKGIEQLSLKVDKLAVRMEEIINAKIAGIS